MIDKPKGKVEALVDKFFGLCKNYTRKVKEKINHPMEFINTHRANHPLAAKIITAVCCLSVCGLIVVGFAIPRTVTVEIDDSVSVITTVYETTAKRVDSFIEEHEIDFLDGQDIIDAELHDGIADEMVIHITKAFEVPVTADGETTVITTLPKTTGEVLSELGISMGEKDIVEPKKTEELKKGDEIVVKRVTVDYMTEEVKTDYKTRYVADSSITIGETKVTQKGRKGTEEKIYEIVYEDGKQISKTLAESNVTKESRDKIVSYGTKILKGKPSGLKYVEKYTNVRAFSYYYSGTPRGVYGLNCEYGTCAVDRDLIPLGSLLYIEGYGYAIANDVGSAINGKTVDLYMERLAQCGVWGARWTTVYVVEEGNNKRYWE